MLEAGFFAALSQQHPQELHVGALGRLITGKKGPYSFCVALKCDREEQERARPGACSQPGLGASLEKRSHLWKPQTMAEADVARKAHLAGGSYNRLVGLGV